MGFAPALGERLAVSGSQSKVVTHSYSAVIEIHGNFDCCHTGNYRLEW